MRLAIGPGHLPAGVSAKSPGRLWLCPLGFLLAVRSSQCTLRPDVQKAMKNCLKVTGLMWTAAAGHALLSAQASKCPPRRGLLPYRRLDLPAS